MDEKVLSKKKLSKAERKVERVERNKSWQLMHRSLDSTKDLNPRHTLYYQRQLMDLKKEWQLFVRSMKKGLPVSFRVSEALSTTLSARLANKLEFFQRRLRGRFIQMNGEVVTGEVLHPVEWSKQTYAMSVDNYTLAHEQSLQDFHHFVMAEVALGHVVRQELVSMIPVILLNLNHSHQVLDCCAAPGSKTEQILALMQRSARKEKQDALSGFIMANDTDPKRLQTLTNRYEKCFIPNMMFSCMDAEKLSSYFPKDAQKREQFDRILCDVPCSGDATFRKSPHLWRLFRPRVGIEFHMVQLQIVKEAFKILKVGGRLVYSTCSLNPMEDEAVVAELLRLYRGKIQLVDSRPEECMPGLKYRRGINSWHSDIDTFLLGEDEAEESDSSDEEGDEKDGQDEKPKLKTRRYSKAQPSGTSRQQTLARLPPLIASLNPPSTSKTLPNGKTINEVAEMHLDKCLRILPHDQDTGGFFIAVFEKIDSIPYNPKEHAKMTPSEDANAESQSVKNNLQIVGSKKSKGSNAQVTYNANTKQHKVNVLNNTHGMMKELGFNAKVADSTQLISFQPHKVMSLQKCCEFPLLNFYSQYISWRKDLLLLDSEEADSEKKMFCFVQRSQRKPEDDAGDGGNAENAEYIDPSELIVMPTTAYDALHSWAVSVPMLQFGSNLTCHPSKVNTKGFALNPYCHVGLQTFSRPDHVSIALKDFVELLRLICIKSQNTAADPNNPFAKEVKRIVSLDYFEDISASSADKSKALYMQHEGLETAAHITMETSSLANLSERLRACAANKKSQYLLFVHVARDGSVSSTGPAAAGNNNNTSVLGKRRMSKAEKKKLTKQKTTSTTSNVVKTEDNENDEQEEVAQNGEEVTQEADGMSLLFWVSALEEDAKDSAIDFSSHWLMLTPADVCQSFLSILA